MDLFKKITPETQKLIDENVDIINECLPAWISTERIARSGIAQQVLNYLSQAKQKRTNRIVKIHSNDKRTESIKRLVRTGYCFADFKKVIDYKIFDWWETNFREHLTPETLFASKNFPKYYEAAQELVVKAKDKTPAELVGVIKPMGDE
jgi:uncharacterized phage protein (TIGR02220 family)